MLVGIQNYIDAFGFMVIAECAPLQEVRSLLSDTWALVVGSLGRMPEHASGVWHEQTESIFS